jgi:hypothetical protein
MTTMLIKQYDLRHSSFDATWFFNNNDTSRFSNGHVQIIMGTKDYHVQNIQKSKHTTPICVSSFIFTFIKCTL